MNFKSLLGNIRKKQLAAATIRRAANLRPRLRVESLEDRAVPATVPTVLSVTPPTGGLLAPTGGNISVKFSEDVTGAATAANYSLFAQDGRAIPFTVSYNGATTTATITPTVALQAGTYSLFIRGDQVVDLDDDLALSRPGELVVANNNGRNISTVSLANTHLTAPTTQVLPSQGNTNFNPRAVATGDINGDGLSDLVVAAGAGTGANLTFNEVDVFLGRPGGGYASVPGARLALPTVTINDVLNAASPTAIVVTDLNADGRADIAVANQATNNVSVFVNQTLFVGDPLTFSARADFAAGNAPSALVAGRFNNDANVDLAVANGTADANNNFTVSILSGTGTGSFSAPTPIVVGTTGPANVTNPNSLAVGEFDGASVTIDDLVVGGGNLGIGVLLNTSAGGAPTFAPVVPVNVGGVTSVATGVVRSNSAAADVDDVVATTAVGGNLVAALNDGAGTIRATGGVAAGVAAPGRLSLTNLNGNFRPELQYVNGDVAGGLVARPSLQTGLIADATNAGPIVITSNNHGLQNGQRVLIAGVGGNTAANGTFYINNVTANTFELVGSTGNGAYTAGTGTWIALHGTITNVSGNGVSPIVVTSPNHGLRTGQQVTITGVGGNTNANSPAGLGGYFVTVIDANTFSLNGTTGNGTYTANTGSFATLVAPTGNSPVGLALTDFSPKLDALGNPVFDVNGDPVFRDGLLDALVVNSTSNTFTMYTGSPAGGAASDGTFLASSHLPTSTNVQPGLPAVADLNADGIPDLVVPMPASRQIQIYRGLKDGGYNPTPTTHSTGSPTTGNTPVAVAFGDINGDGFTDIAVANQGSSNVAIFNNNGAGTFPASPNSLVTVGSAPTDLELADLNGDGALDLVVPHNGGSTVNRGLTLRLGNGDGTFQAATEMLTGMPLVAITAADFDRDGHTDFAVAEDVPAGSGRVQILRGTGAGTLAIQAPVAIGPNPTDVLVADFDADGFQDIATISRSATTPNHVSVMLNNDGTGFQTSLHTTLSSDTPLLRVAAFHADQDPFIDLVVTSLQTTAGQNTNNVQVLKGVGDGGFETDVVGYTVGGGGTTLTPTHAAVVADPFMRLTAFDVQSKEVRINLIQNGDFEERTLDGQQGILDGWTTFKLRDETTGSRGAWMIQTGNTSPLSSTFIQSANWPGGQFSAMLDQSILNPSGPFEIFDFDFRAEGSHAIYQDITIPANATSALLTTRLYMDSFRLDVDPFTGAVVKIPVPWSDPASNPQLNYRTADPNQQVRVDILALDPTAPDYPLDIGSTVLLNVFQTRLGDPTLRTISFQPGGGSDSNPNTFNPIDLSQFAGQTIRLRIATTNNHTAGGDPTRLLVGLDDVKVEVVSEDNTNPDIRSVRLRNPTYLAGPASAEQSTDLTVVGRVGDNLTVGNVSRVVFDINNNGFGGADDVVVTNFDVAGNFSFTLSGLLPGLRVIPVRVVDGAGNFLNTVFSFVVQAPSQTIWQAQGPGPIDVSNQGVNYTSVSGKISGIAVDPRDPSGNTIYISAPNGGVWRTTNGGNDWTALTDNVIDATGTRTNVPVGALGIGNNGVIYAATGVDDNSPTSRPSIGVLKSTDDGRTWTVLGGGVFAGARVSRMGVDPRNSNIVFVAVASWFNDPTRPPAVFRTTNGGATWTNVLNAANMFNPGGVPLGAGAALASVTDLLIDPFNPGRIIIGLGNIGQVPAAATAGLWKSADGGATWFKAIGGDKTVGLGNPTTIPDGTQIGRITLAQGTGRVGDERVIYALLSQPPSGLNPRPIEPGGSKIFGLYKTKDNMLNFTKVMLKERVGPIRWVDMDVFHNEGDTVGAMVVDPTDPNVVYIGGNRRVGFLGDPPAHSLIRVDTGNMRDADYEDFRGPQREYNNALIPNDGDDIDKAIAGWDYQAGAFDEYPDSDPEVDYHHEGVYWYELEQGVLNSQFSFNSFLPGATYRMAIDPQGRLLFGTAGGLFRGLPLGFDYDFTSGGFGILGQFWFGVATTPNPPGMQITGLNGNLQISDLSGAAIDPIDPTRYYLSSFETGTALTAGSFAGWASNGTFSTAGVYNAVATQVATPSPLNTPQTPTVLYRLWNDILYSNELTRIPELSADGGITFTVSSLTDNGGIALQDNSPFVPVLALNPKKFFNAGENKFFDELLFGVDRVYVSRSNGNAWDTISGVLSPGNFVSALAFAPSANGVYFAGTTDGKFFVRPGGGAFIDRTAGLPAGAKINGITVHPNNANVVYVMLDVRGGTAVYQSTDQGQTWIPLGGTTTGATIPLVPAYTMAIDPRPSSGAVGGRLYVGTDVGVFVSVDGGETWLPLGKALPGVPVVSLQFSEAQETLVAATQGRGVFTLSTDHSGPAIVDTTASTPTSTGALGDIVVTFNKPVDPRTFTAEGNTPGRSAVALSLLTGIAYKTTRVTELYNELMGRAPTLRELAVGRRFFAPANGELNFTAYLLAHPTYFSDPANGNNSNAQWIESVWQDLFGRTATGDTLADEYLDRLAAVPPNATAALKFYRRREIMTELVVSGVGKGAFQQSVFEHHKEYLTGLVASMLNRYLARNYPRTAGAPNSTVDLSEISPIVDRLLLPTRSLRNELATILSTTETYQKSGNDIALPAGVTSTAVVLGNFTGTTEPGFGKPILDLAVVTSDNKVLVFAGKVGGGFSSTPALTLNLPTNAAPSDLVLADFNGDGLDDLAVANGGLTSAGANSVSVFRNTTPPNGPISFATRVDLNGGNNPVSLLAGDADGDGKVDLVVAAGQANGSGDFVVQVHLGDGAGNFAAPTSFKVGDNSPSAGELKSPTDIAFGDVTGSARPDLVVSGDNGVVVLTNTTAAAGAPAFTPLASRISNTSSTSVIVAPMTGNAKQDIAATTDLGGGQLLLFRNTQSSTFVSSVVGIGGSPRSIRAADMNGDGRPDLLVARSGNENGLSVLFNEMDAPPTVGNPLDFTDPIKYPVTGTDPIGIAVGDVNQDGTLDIAIGYEGSEFLSVLPSTQVGVLQVPTDRVWLDWLYESLTGKTYTAPQLTFQEASLAAKSLVYLTGPDGAASPLSVTPTDASNQSYRLEFAPRILDGKYTLVLGPNTSGVNLRDFGDTDGSFANTGSPMNQNQNAVNGEVPGDRFIGEFAVNHTDNGRFVTALFQDFLGSPGTVGRPPDNPSFNTIVAPVEAARLASLTSVATTMLKSQEHVDRLITDVYQRFLGRSPLSGSATAELESARVKIINGTLTVRNLVASLLSSVEHFANAGGNNTAWLTRVYDDLGIAPDLIFTRLLAALNTNRISRVTAARIVVYSPAALQRVVTEYFVQFLGRTPIRNADPRLDETTALVRLLRLPPFRNRVPGDLQVMIKLLSSPEYLRLNGDSNFEWLKSMYLKVLGRPTIDTSVATGTEFNTMLDTLLAGPRLGYETARQNAITGPLVLGSQEYRDRIFTEYYIEFLNRSGLTMPTAQELAAQQAWYASNGSKLEAVAANLLSSAEYLPLDGSGSQNQTWLTKVYNDLLDRGINDGTAQDQQTAQTQLAYLNANSANTAAVQAARYKIALQILSSAEYRRFVIAGFLNLYLGKAKPTRPGPGDPEIDDWVLRLSQGQQAVLGLMLKGRDYFMMQ